MDQNRYVFDTLYGAVSYPEYVWEVLPCPELQRLREVRLCNVNSLCLPGGANINRYEHSLGVAHLALNCVESWPEKLDDKTMRRIVLAALLHDVGSSAFGHSVQYLIAREGFEHESTFDMVYPGKEKQFDYSWTGVEQIYFGMGPRLPKMLSRDEFRAISNIAEGKTPYGPLINGSVDLDNIDNVFRLAYHIGIIRSGQIGLDLSKSISIRNNQLIVKAEALPLLSEWYNTRKILYRYLLLNPDEFSAKCMLEEALMLARGRSTKSFNWNLVDFELLAKLAAYSAETKAIVSRLMLGDLYGCIGIYSTSVIPSYEELQDHSTRNLLERKMGSALRGLPHPLKSAEIRIHAIKDVNKTQRQVRGLTDQGKSFEIGTPSREILVGVFFKNVNFSQLKVEGSKLEQWGAKDMVMQILRNELHDPNLKEIAPYSERLGF